MTRRAPAPVARTIDYEGGGRSVWTWCPGCDLLHPFAVADPQGKINRGVTWEWDGNLERPTFTPSLLVHGTVHLCAGEHPDLKPCPRPDSCGKPGHAIRDDGVRCHGAPHTRDPSHGDCHSYVRDGQWQFLDDSAHRLAGQTVPMVPLPEGWL